MGWIWLVGQHTNPPFQNTVCCFYTNQFFFISTFSFSLFTSFLPKIPFLSRIPYEHHCQCSSYLEISCHRRSSCLPLITVHNGRNSLKPKETQKTTMTFLHHYKHDFSLALPKYPFLTKASPNPKDSSHSWVLQNLFLSPVEARLILY